MQRRWLAALVAILVQSATASAGIITFEEFAHGEIVDSQLSATLGVTISAVNPNQSFDIAAAFDTDPIASAGTTDTDLQAPFDGGNAMDADLGRVLVISETDEDGETGFVQDADDEGQRPAGELVLQFDQTYQSLGFHVLDIEMGDEEDMSFVDFYVGGNPIPFATFSFMALATMNPGVVYFDNYANVIQPFSAGAAFDEVHFRMGGSGAIDNIVFVPEPSTWLLIGLGAMALVARCRRYEAADTRRPLRSRCSLK